MIFREWINERTINILKVNKIKKVFEKVPGNTPESIATYVVNALNAFGIKTESGKATYISGPMTNLPDFNWPVFIYAEKYIDGKVFNPANPHGTIIKKPKTSFNWGDYMTEDIYDLVKCNSIVILPGYSKSTGAKTEISIGEKILNVKSKELKKKIGNEKYKLFMNDVKNQYIKDGFEKDYKTIIEPMLSAKTEKEASSAVKTYIPSDDENEQFNEGIVDSIKDFGEYINKKSLKSVLSLIGLIFKKKGLKKIVR